MVTVGEGSKAGQVNHCRVWIEVAHDDAEHICGVILKVLGCGLKLDADEGWIAGRTCPAYIVVT